MIQRLIARPEFGPFVLLVVELSIFWSINHDFLSPQNISNTLAFTVELGLIALAMTLLMTSGEFDLSVGSVFGFSPVVMWTVFNGGFASLEIAFMIAILLAGVIGFVNGWFVTRLKIASTARWQRAGRRLVSKVAELLSTLLTSLKLPEDARR